MSALTYQASPVSRAALENMGDQLRGIFAAETVPFLPVAEIVELVLPRTLSGYTFEVQDQSEMGDDHGRSYPDERRLILRSDVYDGLLMQRGRDRFTACHEIGHLVLHPGLRLSRRIGDAPLPPYRDPEWQANYLASCLLMPAGFVRRHSTAAQVMMAFGVSRDAARVRMRHLKMEVSD